MYIYITSCHTTRPGQAEFTLYLDLYLDLSKKRNKKLIASVHITHKLTYKKHRPGRFFFLFLVIQSNQIYRLFHLPTAFLVQIMHACI